MLKRYFYQGEIVRHRSGGPAMTVARVITNTSPDEYECTWFVGDELRMARFSLWQLVEDFETVAATHAHVHGITVDEARQVVFANIKDKMAEERATAERWRP